MPKTLEAVEGTLPIGGWSYWDGDGGQSDPCIYTTDAEGNQIYVPLPSGYVLAREVEMPLEERKVIALERIADLLAGKDGNRAQVEASCSGIIYNSH